MKPWFNSWVRKIHWRRDRLPIPVFLGFPCVSAGKESTCNVGDLGSIPGLGRSPGEGKGYPLQYSGLDNSMDCIIHGVKKSWTQLSDFHFQGVNIHMLPQSVVNHHSETCITVQCVTVSYVPYKYCCITKHTEFSNFSTIWSKILLPYCCFH